MYKLYTVTSSVFRWGNITMILMAYDSIRKKSKKEQGLVNNTSY